MMRGGSLRVLNTQVTQLSHSIKLHIRGKVRSKMREAKQNWIEDQCSAIDKAMERGNSKEAFSTLKTITKNNTPRAAVIEDKDGN